MKAVRVVGWGRPLAIEDVPQPTAGNDEVLVRVHAASVNPVDKMIAAGYLQGFFSAPLTLGSDFAGEIVTVGASVQQFKPGDRVYGMSPALGSFAEYAAVKAFAVASSPRSLDDVQAASVPLGGLSAWQTLFDLAQLKSGERVLILGAGGAIGSLAVQLAKGKGAYVIALARGDKAEFVKGLGADEFIDGDSQRFEDVVGHVDVVLDTIGGDYVERSYTVLKPGGRFVTLAAMLPEGAGKDRGIVASGAFTQPNGAQLQQLAELIDDGKLRVFVNRTFPLAETPAAESYKAADGSPGKVVIIVK